MREGRPPGNETTRLLRLGANEISDVLGGLESAAIDSTRSRRRHRRYPYRRPTIEVDLRQPGDASSRRYEMTPRNLSARGISILHGAFSHIGARVLVHLQSLAEDCRPVEGTIRSCRYVRVGVYELGVEFDTEIVPAEFCMEARSASVAVLEPDEVLGALVLRHLAALNATAERLVSGHELIRTAMRSRCELLLVDVDSTEARGLDTIRALRSRGYMGRIAAMTAFDERTRHEPQIDFTVCRPPAREELGPIVQSNAVSAITSSYQSDRHMRDLIASFVDRLPAQICALEALLASGETVRLAEGARALSAGATGFGFAPVAAAATALEASLASAHDLTDAARSLRELSRLCRSVRPPG
ncbi:MAG: PilZ domain-containing protein [Phycisphaeraceae bacterium]|nr:PilZ domain-containing protein [Phycisphaeraceae bacterium]